MLARYLAEHGLRVTQAADGRQMFAALEVGRFDLVVLDLMMPGEDGLSLCRRLRERGDTPVIMLTALGAETDRIVGLELGADDYVTKPFNPRELLARVRAVLRRAGTAAHPSETAQAEAFGFDGWTLHVARRVLASPEGARVELTTGEFDLLLAFVLHPQRTLTRDQLLDLAHGRASQLFDRSIDVQVSRLRRKVEPDPAQPTLIRTVRSGGYIFTATVEPRTGQVAGSTP